MMINESKKRKEMLVGFDIPKMGNLCGIAWKNYERIGFFCALRNGDGGIGIWIEIELLLGSEQFLKAQVIVGKGF